MRSNVVASHPTGSWTVTVFVILVAVLAVIELLARPPASPAVAQESSRPA